MATFPFPHAAANNKWSLCGANLMSKTRSLKHEICAIFFHCIPSFIKGLVDLK